jgi:uncharacterized membrane protein YtjA (UPF0391 family)
MAESSCISQGFVRKNRVLPWRSRPRELRDQLRSRNAANSGVILRWPFSCSIKLAGYPDTTAQENQQIQIEIIHMLSWTLMFLVVALIAALLGFTGIAGTAAGIARILFVIFVVMFLVSVIMGRKRI